jgi:Protein of unknown function (DUF3592)
VSIDPEGKLLRRLQFVLLSVLVVGPASFINWIYGDMLVAHHAMQSWQEVPARIESVEFHTYSISASRRTHVTTARYQYEFAGRSYHGFKVTWGNRYDNLPFHENAYRELQDHQQSGVPFRCFVNPHDPEQAILYRQLRPEILVLVTVLEMMLGLPLTGIILKQMACFASRWGVLPWAVDPAPYDPAEPLNEAFNRILIQSDRARAIWTTLVALAVNLIAVPLYIYLPAAPEETFWPRPIGAILVVIGWLFAAGAISVWRRPKRSSPPSHIPA